MMAKPCKLSTIETTIEVNAERHTTTITSGAVLLQMSTYQKNSLAKQLLGRAVKNDGYGRRGAGKNC
jgi:hypothetical protein